MGRRLTQAGQERHRAIVAALAENEKHAVIAERCGVTRRTVQHVAERYGLTRARGRPRGAIARRAQA